MGEQTMKAMSGVGYARQQTPAQDFLRAQQFMPLKMTRKVYRKFLEDSGIVAELTKVLYKLYDEKEKPPYFNHHEDFSCLPPSYFKKYFGETDYDMPNIYWLREELEVANSKLTELKKENEELRKQLCRQENYWELKPFDYRY